MDAVNFALLAGVLATFNPCGFALLPAYLSALVLGGNQDAINSSAAYRRALSFSGGMAIGLVSVFSIFAVVIYPLSVSIEKYLPVVTAIIGAALIVFGIFLLSGRSLAVKRILNPNIAPGKQFLTQVGYGVTYALGSLSCTIGPFLAITSNALATGNLYQIVGSFVFYGLGMAAAVTILALLTAATNRTLISRIRGVTPWLEKFSALFVILVGVYITTYAWFEIQSFQGTASSNPIIEAALRVQSAIVQFVAQTNPIAFVLIAAIMIFGVLALSLKKSVR